MNLYRTIHIYTKNIITGLYDVGYFEPSGKWCVNSSYENESRALMKVRYLNGLDIKGRFEELLFLFCDWGARNV